MRDGIVVGVEYALRIGIDEGIHRSRIEAFGAIRRAANEARWYDRRAHALADEIAKAGHNPYATTAMAIRFAIRAAIRTETSHDISSTRTEYRA